MAEVGALRGEDSGTLCHSHLSHHRRCHHLHARHSRLSKRWYLPIAPSKETSVAGYELPLERREADRFNAG